MTSDKLPDSEETLEPGCKSNVLSLPSDCEDDILAFSDIPIMKVDTQTGDRIHNEKGNSDTSNQINLIQGKEKPKGSAYVSAKMSIGDSEELAAVNICIDTGADFTLCDVAFLKNHFGGHDAIKHIYHPYRVPNLRSASGHVLQILGKVEVTLLLGEFMMNLHVIVHEGDVGMFLLGSDSFYDKLIYDRGKFLAFADSRHPPIPIKYELVKDLVKAVGEYRVAPRSSALIPVNVTDNAQFTGKEVILSPIVESHTSDQRHCARHQTASTLCSPVRNSVSTIDSLGNVFVLVENDTDDVLTILPDTDLATVELISDEDSEEDVSQINLTIDAGKTSELRGKGQWPVSALKGELRDKIPSNVIVQWHKLQETHGYRDDVTETNQNSEDIHRKSVCPDETSSVHNIHYVHDKEERKHLLDGTGEGFPAPPAADSIHPDEKLSDDPDAWLENVDHKHLSDSEWMKLREVLVQNKDAFSKSKTEIGCCNYFKVDLPLKPGTGYLYNKPRPLPFKHREMAAETISELLAKGVIRPSKSPHATNIVCVKKKAMGGVISYRICCDLRQVNEHSVPNRFPNYWIEDAMSKVQGSAFRSAMDFRDAFHMLVLTEESIPVTAFYFNNVLFEYVRVPFGHVCAMNAFCCLMALLCVGYEPSSYYADDLMITTKANYKLSRDQLFDQHLIDIQGMLVRIIDAGLKLVAAKCQWCYGSDKPMDWLGFTMENNLLRPQESKVKAMKEFPVPTTGKQVISFIATASFYRRFIKNFAKEVQPMFNVAYAEPFEWNSAAQASFERVKEIMCSDLVLRLPRQGEPFQIYSDASAGALGVVLCQIDPKDGKSHPCAYGSRKFNASELKLSIPCKELLAIIYGLNLWSYYISGNPIQVYSDCRAWTFLKMQSGASGKISRLALLVSEYDISISYIKGTQNKAADGLSRAHDDGLTKYDDLITARHPALELLTAPKLPEGEVLQFNEYMVKCDEYLTVRWPEILKEFEAQQLAQGKDPDISNINQKLSPAQQRLTNLEKDILKESEYVNQVIQEAAILHVDRTNTNNLDKERRDKRYPFQVNEDLISEGFTPISDDDDHTDSDSLMSDDDVKTTDSSFKAAVYNIRKIIAINDSAFSVEAFKELQAKDEFCSRKIGLIQAKDARAKGSGYFLKRGILMRQMQTRDEQYYTVVCVPEALVQPLMESSHRSLLNGHFGGERYALNMARKYYWPKMKDDIMDFHRKCLSCQYNDKYPVKYSSGYVIRPRWPMHVVHCDLIVGLPRAFDGSYAILLLYDGFSRFTFGIPLASEKADYVVKKLMSHFVAAFGLPWALHSDNGRNVDGSLIRHLALMLGVLKTSTPPYTPNANPTETMCGAVSMLIRKALSGSDKRYWSVCLPFVLNALNSTVHTATGYTPNSLFFGRYQERDPVPLIPFDAEAANVNEYYQKVRRFQELAFQIVRSRNERKLLAHKAKWDSTARIHSYKEGDFVLVKNLNPASGPGKAKLRAKYIGPFRVIKAYTSSLIVTPWTENSRLEEFYRDENLFRLMHRGDIKPFHTRQVSVKHCKPFKGDISEEQIVDPIMLTRFLDSLGIDPLDEIISEIDPSGRNDDSTIHSGPSSSSSSSSGGGPPGGNNPPGGVRPDGPPPPGGGGPRGPPNGPNGPPPPGGGGPRGPPSGPHGPPPRKPPRKPFWSEPSSSGFSDVDPEVPPADPGDVHSVGSTPPPELNPVVAHGMELGERRLARDKMFGNLDIPRRDKKLLRQRARLENLGENVAVDRARRRLLVELEALVESADPHIRRKAEQDLRDVLDEIKGNRDRNSTSSDSEHSPNRNVDSDNDFSEDTPVSDVVVPNPPEIEDPDLADMPPMEWDDVGTALDPDNPGLEGAAAPPITPARRPRGGGRITPESARRIRGRERHEVAEWVENIDPQERADLEDPDLLVNFGNEPVAGDEPVVQTRTGRVVRPPQRYSDANEAARARNAKEAENIVRAKKLSMAEVKPSSIVFNKAATKTVAKYEANLELLKAKQDVAQAEAEHQRDLARAARLRAVEADLEAISEIDQAEAEAEAAEELARVAEEERRLALQKWESAINAPPPTTGASNVDITRRSTLMARTPPAQTGASNLGISGRSTLTARTPVTAPVAEKSKRSVTTDRPVLVPVAEKPKKGTATDKPVAAPRTRSVAGRSTSVTRTSVTTAVPTDKAKEAEMMSRRSSKMARTPPRVPPVTTTVTRGSSSRAPGANRDASSPVREPSISSSRGERLTRHDTPPHRGRGTSRRTTEPPKPIVPPVTKNIGEPTKASRAKSAIPPTSKTRSVVPPASKKSVVTTVSKKSDLPAEKGSSVVPPVETGSSEVVGDIVVNPFSRSSRMARSPPPSLPPSEPPGNPEDS